MNFIKPDVSNRAIKVLVACEYSGVIRDAFCRVGFDATSCDLLPTETSGKHYEGSVFDILNDGGWDLLIAHPPCKYLSSAGLHLCNIQQHGKKAIQRIKSRNKAIEFFLNLYNAPINHICLENPIGHISSTIIKPTQIIHPYYFGEKEMKRTALWLKNLPKLEYRMTDDLFGKQTATDKPEPSIIQLRKETGQIKKRYWTDDIFKGKFKTGKERSRSFQCVADAMASQWSSFILRDYKNNYSVGIKPVEVILKKNQNELRQTNT